MIDILLVIIIVGILYLAIRPLVKFKKENKGGCYGCSSSTSCKSKSENNSHHSTCNSDK